MRLRRASFLWEESYGHALDYHRAPAAAVRQRRLLGSRSLLLVNPWAMPVIGFLQKKEILR
jgi:hypothetical protein